MPALALHRCDAFRNDLARARELQAEVWADELVDISDAELSTREAIRQARLRMQSRQWLAGKYNSRFADKPAQVAVNVGVAVVLPEAERQATGAPGSGAAGQPGQKRNFYAATARAVTQSAARSFAAAHMML